MLNTVTMKTGKHVWILITVSFIILCIYVGNIVYNLKFKEKYWNMGQILLEGEQKNAVLNKQLELLLSGHPSSVVQKTELFHSPLSQDELKIISICQTSAVGVWLKEYTAFSNTRHICVNHHSYLKENDSILIEVGGNFGADASLFTALYDPRHLIVEPLEYYANILRDKFKDNKRVTVLNFGLGKKTEVVLMDMAGEASNIYLKTGNIMVDVKNSTEFFQNIGVGIFSVDLLTMDCEGCELDVLENLVESGMVKYFKNIQFENHVMVGFLNREEYLMRYCTLQEYLQRTHRTTFQYKHVWENWRLKDLK